MKQFFAMAGLLLGTQLYVTGQYRLQPLTLSVYQPTQAPGLPAIQLYTPVAANNGASSNCSSNCSIILPLTALELQANRLNDRQVALIWKTKNETASRGFEIERSLGDPTRFYTVGSTPANTGMAVEKRYTSTDANTYAGNSFYRIRQLDLNGNFAYSNTVLVRGYDPKGSIWVWPNPASSVAMLTCYTTNSGTATLKVLSAQGQTMHQATWTVAAGSNQLRLPVSRFPPGTYSVQLIWPGGQRSEVRLVKD
jgi:hypothetical protein